MNERLSALVHALRALHKSLVASVQADYERLHGGVAGPAALWQLLLHDPHFAWLRPMSRLMAELDERLDEGAPPVDTAALADARSDIERLISDRGDGNEFTANYLQLLQRDPDVLMAHAELRKQLGG